MSQLLVVILDDLKPLPELLKTWRKAGVSGATILESVGAYRAENWLSRAGLGALSRMFEAEEVRRRTILTVVEDEMLEQAVAVADHIVGGFNRPNSGVLFAVPISLTLGTKKSQFDSAKSVMPPAIEPQWFVSRDTSIMEAAATLDLTPTIVRADTPVDQVVQSMLGAPNVHVACVVEDDNRLVGLLDLQALADNLFFRILPEEFLGEITDLERVMRFADHSRTRSATDAMHEPISVKQNETIKVAFKRMHEHHLSGLPIVNDKNQVVGYINLLELMAVCITGARRASSTEEAPSS